MDPSNTHKMHARIKCMAVREDAFYVQRAAARISYVGMRIYCRRCRVLACTTGTEAVDVDGISLLEHTSHSYKKPLPGKDGLFTGKRPLRTSIAGY